MTPAGETDRDAVHDVRPQVAHDSGNRPLWIGIGAILLLGFALFIMLEGRRESATAPAVRPRVADLAVAPAQLPPLYIPPEPEAAPLPAAVRPAAATPLLPQQQITERALPSFPAQQFNPFPPTRIAPDFQPPTPPPAPISTRLSSDTGPAIIFDESLGDTGSAKPGTPGSQPSTPTVAVATRARASRSRDKAFIIPQGTLIAAVLETALDSTQPGQARALVSRDVPNLYGPILIPRGSRLYGEYRGELGAGQKRAMVQWTRLETPDGVTIAIDSPAADQLGRAGIKGKVNSQFAARFGGALLQSVIDVGAIAAVGGISNSRFFVPIPGAVQGTTSQLVGQPPKPTIKVRQGTRISVFVARDLDFSSVSRRP